MINNMLDLLLCSMANYQMDVSVLPKTKTLVELIRLTGVFFICDESADIEQRRHNSRLFKLY